MKAIDLQLRYGDDLDPVVALDNVSLDAESGEIVAIMGASGSGKSSLLHALAGLQTVAAGDIVVGGHRLSGASEAQRASARLESIGVVFQQDNLIPEFSAAENLLISLEAQGLNRTAARKEAHYRLEQVGLAGLEKRLPSQLSGGQRQRVGIARAIAGGRSVLLADEPTGALDSTNTRELFVLLRSIADDGSCVVVVTHDESVSNVADRLLQMRDGRLESRLSSSTA